MGKEVSAEYSGAGMGDCWVEDLIADRIVSSRDCEYMDEEVLEEDNGAAVANEGGEISHVY